MILIVFFINTAVTQDSCRGNGDEECGWGKQNGSCRNQCWGDLNNNGGTGNKMNGDSCNQNLCCDEANAITTKTGSKHIEWWIDPRYFLIMSYNQDIGTHWNYNWEASCQCSGNGTCGKNPNDNDYNPRNDIFRKFYWVNGANSNNQQKHPNALAHNTCVEVTKDWGWFIFKISTREDDPYFSDPAKVVATKGNQYDPVNTGVPYGPMALPALKIEVDLLRPDGVTHTKVNGNYDFLITIHATPVCSKPVDAIKMWDDGALDPKYHYSIADDGKRPYDPLMKHDDGSLTTTPSIKLQEGDYFFKSAEDTIASTGFWFPEMQWYGPDRIAQEPTNYLYQDCYVHYRIVVEGTCRDSVTDISHPDYGSPAGINVPHPDYTTLHNAAYPWFDNSAILFNFQLDKHWFVPNAITQGAGNAEYYFHILAEDNFIPGLVHAGGTNPGTPSTPNVHSHHGTKYCSPMITHHVCGINSSKLRKYDATNFYTYTIIPKTYRYCSINPDRNDKIHKFPIQEMENTNDHCSVTSRYYPTEINTGKKEVDSDAGAQPSIYTMVNTGTRVFNWETPTEITSVVTDPRQYEWTIQEGTETMVVPFYVQIVADGASTKEQIGYSEQHEFTIRCCGAGILAPTDGTIIDDPGFQSSTITLPDQGGSWLIDQVLDVIDTLDTTTSRDYVFREAVSNNKWCKQLSMRQALINTFPDSFTLSSSPNPELTSPFSQNFGAYDSNNAMEVGGAINFKKFSATDTHTPHVIGFYIVVAEFSEGTNVYGNQMGSVNVPIFHKLILICGIASTTLYPPTILPTSANTPGFYQMIEPDTDYVINQFTVSNNGCPINQVKIVTSTVAGKTSASDYKSTNGIAPVYISSLVSNSQITAKVPFIQELERDFYFRINGRADGLREDQTDNIKVRRVNCYYVDITPTAPVYVKTDFVKDVGLAFDGTPIIYTFIELVTNHPQCNTLTHKSSKDPAYPGVRQTKLDETPVVQSGNTLYWTAVDPHNPDIIEFYLVAQEARLKTYISPKHILNIICGPDSTSFMRTENGVDMLGPPNILPLKVGKDSAGVAYDYYEMINPITTYTINRFNTTNHNGCPLASIELVPITGGSNQDFLNNDGNDTVAITTDYQNWNTTLFIPNITTHTHFYNFRLKATAVGGQISYTDNIKIKKINCDVSAVQQDPLWPTLVQNYEEKQTFKYTKNIQYFRNATIEYLKAFILNVPECPINHFEISGFQHSKNLGTNVNWSNVVYIDDKGYLTFNDLYNVRELHYIFIKASAGNEKRVWSDDSMWLASLEITEIPYIVNEPPYFKSPLFPSVFHLDEGETEYPWTLPNMTDPEGKPVTITILNFDARWMVFDNSTRRITFVPQNEPDFGSHTLDIMLTDADGVKSRLYEWEICISQPSVINHSETDRMCPTFMPQMDPEYGEDPDRDYSAIIDYCKTEMNAWSNADIDFAKGLSKVYLPCGDGADNKGCDKILSEASGLNITQSCCHSYTLTDNSQYKESKCKKNNEVIEKVKEIYDGIDNLGWNTGDVSSFCYHLTWMKKFPKYFDTEKNKMLFTDNLVTKHIDLPSGICDIKDVSTKKGINCDINELENLKGPSVCYDGNDCKGSRTCSKFNFCEGEDGCDKSFCVWKESDPSIDDWQCYLNRYDDVRALLGPKNLTGAEQHYKEIGLTEKRDKTCGQCSLRINSADQDGKTQLDEKVGCIKQESEQGCLGLKAATQTGNVVNQMEIVDKFGNVVGKKACNVEPLKKMMLIANSQSCGDGGRLNAGQFNFQIVGSLSECESICANQIGCEWFDLQKINNEQRCSPKKAGCEKSKKSEVGSWSYRPTGWKSPDCLDIPEKKFVDNYISLVKEDVCKRRERIGLPCIPTEKRRLDLNITKITPQKKLHIGYSEKLLSFDKYFKELGLNQTQLSVIGNQVLNLTYFCNQLPYNATDTTKGSRNRRNLLVENEFYEEPETEEEIVPDLNNWFMTKFTSEEIIIDLNFTYPSLVSAYYEYDQISVTVLQNGFFSAFKDYQFLEPNYQLQARPVPPLCSEEDIYCGSSIGLFIGLLLLLCLLLCLMLMCCMNIGMGRLWSLYFMLQLITNIDNFEIIKQSPSSKELLSFLELISNFKVTSIGFVKSFFTYEDESGQNWIFNSKEMIISFIIFIGVLGITFGLWKNWPRSKRVQRIKKLVIWSPIFRCIMMLWFGTALWSMTWFHSSRGGFYNNLIDQNNPIKSTGNRRMLEETSLQGLGSRYPTQMYPQEPENWQQYGSLDMTLSTSWLLMIEPLLKVLILVGFPIMSYVYIKRNYALLSDSQFKIKFSTLYTDMKHKNSAKDTILLLCGRRTIIVLTTVFLNRFHIPLVFCYIYPSIFLLSYYIVQQPFTCRWAYWIELLNETHVITTVYFTFFFTEWTSNIKARYQFSAFYLDLTIWVIILNQIGIFYETYLGVRAYYRKRSYQATWRQHLKDKEEMSLLLIEYWNYYGINQKQCDIEILMKWDVSDLERHLDDMRKRKEEEVKVVQLQTIVHPPQPLPIITSPVHQVEQPVQAKPSILSFASYLDRQQPKTEVRHIEVTAVHPSQKVAMLDVKIQKKLKTSFASFMDNEPGIKLDDNYENDQSSEKQRVYKLQQINKQYLPNISKIIVEEEENEQDSIDQKVVNVYHQQRKAQGHTHTITQASLSNDDFNRKKIPSNFGTFMNQYDPEQNYTKDQFVTFDDSFGNEQNEIGLNDKMAIQKFKEQELSDYDILQIMISREQTTNIKSAYIVPQANDELGQNNWIKYSDQILRNENNKNMQVIDHHLVTSPTTEIVVPRSTTKPKKSGKANFAAFLNEMEDESD